MALDPKFATQFIQSTLFVIEAQCQTKLVSGEVFEKRRDVATDPFDIAGVITVTSASVNGSVAICLTENAFLTLISRMLGEEFKTIDKDLEDGAAELLNTIFGHAKKFLNEKGHTIEKSLPTVIRGSNLSVNQTRGRNTVVIPFSGGDVKFFMEIGIDAA